MVDGGAEEIFGVKCLLRRGAVSPLLTMMREIKIKIIHNGAGWIPDWQIVDLGIRFSVFATATARAGATNKSQLQDKSTFLKKSASEDEA